MYNKNSTWMRIFSPLPLGPSPVTRKEHRWAGEQRKAEANYEVYVENLIEVDSQLHNQQHCILRVEGGGAQQIIGGGALRWGGDEDVE